MSVIDATKFATGAAEFLLSRRTEIGLPKLEIRTQAQFLEELAGHVGFSLAERSQLLDQIEMVLRNLYAHLPFKKIADPTRDPFRMIDEIRPQLEALSDMDFHACVLLVLATVRDVHTSYVAPSPYRGAVAFLPFEIRFFEDSKRRVRFLVTKCMATEDDSVFRPAEFEPGVEVITWNGMPALEATMMAAQLQPGANQDAELTRGTLRMTLRSIASHSVDSPGGAPPFPVRNRARIGFVRPGEKREREIELPWMVATGLGGRRFSSAAFSSSPAMAELQQWSKCSYRPEKAAQAARAPGSDFIEAQLASDPPTQGFPHPDLLRNPEHPAWSVGYLRIRHFANDVGSFFEEQRLEELREIIARLDREARGGLILDIRGNPGGQIRVAERALQYFSPREIKPLRFHFPRTELVSSVLQVLRESPVVNPEFSPWLAAQPGDDTTDPQLTPGRPLTPPEIANDTGQIYQSPVVLLFDAMTYSAADMFAAGFQDHEVGQLIGVDCSTGGGGANAWMYSDIRDNLPNLPGFEFQGLPADCELSVAVRRCFRTGAIPEPIEDIGIAPNFFHARTERDILAGNADLFEFAYDRLMEAPLHRVDVVDRAESAEGVVWTIITGGLGWVRFRVQEKILAQGEVADGEKRSFRLALNAGEPEPERVRVEGFLSEQDCLAGSPPLAAPRVPFHGEESAAQGEAPLTFFRQRQRERSS